MRIVPSAVLAFACLFGLPAHAAEPTCTSSAEGSRALVVGFYEQALLRKQPRAAFEAFVSPAFVEHKRDIPEGTRDAAVAFLEGLIADVPAAEWEILRTVAEPGFVALHARFTPAPGAPEYGIVDIFRVQDCRIVEHWDVVAPPPRAPAA